MDHSANTPRPLAGRVVVAHPIDVASGVLSQSFEDCALPGLTPLILTRRYSTAIAVERPGIFGPGWACNFEMRLKRDLDGYTLALDDGESRIGFDDFTGVLDRGGVLRDPGSFCELLRAKHEIVALRWNPDTSEVTRYWFAEDLDTQWWPLKSMDRPGRPRIDIRYDAAGRLESIVQRRNRRGLRITYGEHGRASEIHFEGAPGTEPQTLKVWQYEYDAAGRLAAATDAAGTPATYEYDASGRLVRESDVSGMVFDFRYDGRGRCVESTGSNKYGATQLEYLGSATKVTDGRLQTTTYVMNEGGQVEQVISPLGNVRRTVYDHYGRVIQIVDASGGVVAYEYDSDGNRSAEVSATGSRMEFAFTRHHLLAQVTDASGARWRYQRDDQGRMTAMFDAAGRTLEYTYDGLDDLTGIRRNDGAVYSLDWGADGNLVGLVDWTGARTRYEYDSRGLPTVRVDALGHRREWRYDELGRTVEAVFPDGAVRTYGYDAASHIATLVDEAGGLAQTRHNSADLPEEFVKPNGGRLTFKWSRSTGMLGAVGNEAGEEWTFEYDDDRRLVGERDFTGRMTSYEHNPDGDVTAIVRGDARIDIKVGAGGRPLEVAHSDGSKVAYEYDSCGRITRADNGVCPIEREYDAIGRVVREKQGGFEIVNRYSALGVREERESSLGYKTAFASDPNGQVSRIDLLAVDRTIEFSRDQVQNETERAIARGARIEQRYDARRRCVSQRASTGHVVWREFTYDGASNLTGIRERGALDTEYGYDVAGRVLIAKTGATEQRFSYDAADNLTGSADGEFRYGRGNRLTSKGGTEYAYDEDGRLIASREAGSVTRYRWNGFDQLTAVVLPNGAQCTYKYDAFGRRVEKSGPAGTTEFVWDGDVVLHEIRRVDGAQPDIAHWEFLPNGYAPVAKIERDQVYLCVTDPAGTPRDLVSASGEVVWSARLTPFGKVVNESSGRVECPVRFQGQWFDSETGLHYNRLRYYDPGAGRYISRDPIGLYGGLNLYRYTRCPINWIDPLALAEDTTMPLEGWRYSQTSAGGNGRYDAIQPSMAEHGWKPGSEPVNVVRLENGTLVGFDNTRPLIAAELGWESIPVRIHGHDERLPASEWTDGDRKFFGDTAKKLGLPPPGDPPTWGELNRIRTAKNGLPPEGTTEKPRVRGKKC